MNPLVLELHLFLVEPDGLYVSHTPAAGFSFNRSSLFCLSRKKGKNWEMRERPVKGCAPKRPASFSPAARTKPIVNHLVSSLGRHGSLKHVKNRWGAKMCLQGRHKERQKLGKSTEITFNVPTKTSVYMSCSRLEEKTSGSSDTSSFITAAFPLLFAPFYS